MSYEYSILIYYGSKKPTTDIIFSDNLSTVIKSLYLQSAVGDVPSLYKGNEFCREYITNNLNAVFSAVHFKSQYYIGTNVEVVIKSNAIDWNPEQISSINHYIYTKLFRYSLHKGNVVATEKGLVIKSAKVSTYAISLLLYLIDQFVEILNESDDYLIRETIMDEDERFEECYEYAILTAFYLYCSNRTSISYDFYIYDSGFNGPATFMESRLLDYHYLFDEFYGKYKYMDQFRYARENNADFNCKLDMIIGD